MRKATNRDRFAHALKHSTLSFLDRFDTEYVYRKCSKLGRLADESHWLVRRLGLANAKRRQVQKYYRDHKARLAEPKENDHEETLTEKLSSKATTLAPARLEAGFSNADTPVEKEYDDAMSITTAVTTFDRASSLALPSLAELSQPAEPFECPICFLLCSFGSEKAWKIHAFTDIRPYVCTLGGSECEDLMFTDRSSWFRHELTHHRSQFACAECTAEFGSEPKFRDHLAKHGESSDERMDDLVAAGRRVQRIFVAGDCPLCDEWEAAKAAASSQVVTGPQLKRHVATHLEQLALFAVPRAVAGDNEEKEETEDAPAGSGSPGRTSGKGTPKEPSISPKLDSELADKSDTVTENNATSLPIPVRTQEIRYSGRGWGHHRTDSWMCCVCQYISIPESNECALCCTEGRRHIRCSECLSLTKRKDNSQID